MEFHRKRRSSNVNCPFLSPIALRASKVTLLNRSGESAVDWLQCLGQGPAAERKQLKAPLQALTDAA